MSVHIADRRTLESHSQNEVLRLEGVVKRFGGITALAGVDLSLRSGFIHGLVGENGAGKSTLIKIICGIDRPDAGRMQLGDLPYVPTRPADAKKIGIQVVHQELNLLNLMSVADNVCFEYLPRRFGLVRRREQYAQAREALNRVGLGEIDLTQPVSLLGIAQQQLIEIARALKSQSRILILDEPTATLTAVESANLFRLLHELATKDVAILLVSHHLDEIMEHCDDVTVMRNGRTISTYATAETSINQLIGDMVERAVDVGNDENPQFLVSPREDDNAPKIASMSLRTQSEQEAILILEGLRAKSSPNPQGISFRVKRGEILGLAGLVGAGRTELLRALAGVDKPTSGHIFLNGKKHIFTSPAQSIRAGIAFVSEDRRHEGLILPMSIACNATLASTDDIAHAGVLSPSRERDIAYAQAVALGLKYGDLQDNVSTLSGGNQQKVVLAKWLARTPDILLLDEPTRGVDVGAKAEIYALIRNLAGQGKAIVLVSSEMRELMALSDRILVLAQHRLVGEVARPEFSQQHILQLAYQQGVS